MDDSNEVPGNAELFRNGFISVLVLTDVRYVFIDLRRVFRPKDAPAEELLVCGPYLFCK
jgi:hypothetical protein